MNTFIDYIQLNGESILLRLLEHCGIVGAAMGIAIPLGVITGVVLSREWARRIRAPVFYILGLGQTIPSLALLALAVGIIGTGWPAAAVAILLYSLIPIARNSYTGVRLVPAATRDAAQGMGMTAWQVLRSVELPLSSSYIISGIRTSIVIAISAGALASLIGAGGLGDFIFEGISLYKPEAMLAGAIPTALLAVAADRGLGRLERRFTVAYVP